jgi:pSer/pThr/pTyr-binding forkhead associated (FHA) protein
VNDHRAHSVTTLRVLSGPHAGKEHSFATPIVIGRARSDLELIDPEISRKHFKLTPVAGGVEIADLDSSNGTWIGDRRLKAPAVLTRKTTVRAGQTSFEVVPKAWLRQTSLGPDADGADSQRASPRNAAPTRRARKQPEDSDQASS